MGHVVGENARLAARLGELAGVVKTREDNYYFR